MTSCPSSGSSGHPLLAPVLALALVATPATARVAVDDTRSRPTVDGTVLVHDTDDGRFRIRYTLEGADALGSLAEDDAPANGLPDAVDAVVEGLVGAWELYVEDEGWRAPGDDGTEGGDGRLDVYMRHIDHNGVAHAEWHGDHWAAYLEVEPDVADMGWDLLASVAAHELHHAIQYSYAVGTHTWVYESSATYAQYRLYADPAAMAAALQLLWSLRLEDPGIGLDVVGDRLEYATLIWVKYLVDRSGGDMTVFRTWWEILEESPEWRDSLDELALELGEADGLALYEGFAEWLYFACDRDDGNHWSEDDGLVCLMPLEATLDHRVESVPDAWEVDPGPDPVATALAVVALGGEETLTLACDGPDEGRWSLRAVALDGGTAVDRWSAEAGGDGRVDLTVSPPDGADEVLLVLANYDAETGASYSCSADPGEGPLDDDDGVDPEGIGEDPGGCDCRHDSQVSGPWRTAVGWMGVLAGLGARRRFSWRRGR